MKIFKKMKKGFTLVELVVVIAVIAILAATSVGIYFGVTESAKKSNDQTVTNQMNKALLLDETLNGKPSTPTDMLAVLEENGFDVTQMTPYSDGSYYLWNSIDNRMLLLDSNGEVMFPAEDKKPTNKYEYFAFISTEEERETFKDYSLYLKNNYSGSTEFYAGVDVGNNYLEEIKYSSDSNTQTSIIRTTAGKLIVDAAEDTVNHYGSGDEVYVKNVSSDTFNLYANIGYMQVSAGEHVVVKEGASVNAIYSEGSDTSKIEGVDSSLIKTSADGSSEDIKSGATDFAGGVGTETSPYLVKNERHFNNINKKSDRYTYFKWVGENEVDASEWRESVKLCGSFDGNNATFSSLKKPLFKEVWNGTNDPASDLNNVYTISNVNIIAQNSASGWNTGIAYGAYVHSLLLENVNVSGYIEGGNASSYICFGAGNRVDSYQYAGTITFKNCNSNATLVATNGYATGFIAHAMFTKEGKIVLTNSNFDGVLSSTSGCRYVNGNYYGGIIEDDQKATKLGTIYDENYNYVAKGKFSKLDVTKGNLPENIGDAFELTAKENTVKATFSLFVSPGPGCFTSSYLSEEINVIDGKLTSSLIRRFDVRVNASGVTETGIHGNNFDIVNPEFNKLDASTVVKVVEYDGNNAIVRITNIDFNDKTI